MSTATDTAIDFIEERLSPMSGSEKDALKVLRAAIRERDDALTAAEGRSAKLETDGKLLLDAARTLLRQVESGFAWDMHVDNLRAAVARVDDGPLGLPPVTVKP